MRDAISSNMRLSEIRDSRGNPGTRDIQQGNRGLEDHRQRTIALKVVKPVNGEKDVEKGVSGNDRKYTLPSPEFRTLSGI